MANASWGKRVLVVAVACCACALIAMPAYGFYYVHSEQGEAVESHGVIEVTCVLDETAQGGGVRSEFVLVPEGGTVADLMNEDVVSSNSQNGVDALHDYNVSSLSERLADKQYTCSVYKAADQKPGTHTTPDGAGQQSDASTPLERYDHVVFTVTA